MIRALREHLSLVFAAAFLGLFFVFNGGEGFMPSRLAMIVWLVVEVLAWKPLHKRFSAQAILFAYFLMSLPFVLVSASAVSLSGFLKALLLALVLSVIVLLFNRRKPEPIKLRRPDLASMIINGDWAQLAQLGVPAREIERMKRLPQNTRFALADALVRGRGDALASIRRIHRSRKSAQCDLLDDLVTNPAYSFLSVNVHHQSDYHWFND